VFIDNGHTQNRYSGWVTFSQSARYLGAIISSDLLDDQEIRGRIQKATAVFGSMRKNLMASKDVWNEIKRRVLLGMILPTLLDGAEHWIVSSIMLAELTSAYNGMIRSCLRMTTHTQRKHSITTEDMLSKLGMRPLVYYLDWKILGYAGHVARMDKGRLPSIMLDAQMQGPRLIGAPPKTHHRQRRECLQRKKIQVDSWRDTALDRNNWRKLIKANTEVLRPRKIKPTWHLRPSELLRCAVEVQFEGKFYVGRVVDFDVDVDTNETIWRVVYDDGDSADYNSHEISRIVCMDEMGVF
jgi:hypothetical protein